MAQQIELTVSYSAGTKVNIGNYESMDVHVSRTEKYYVEGMSPGEVEELFNSRYGELQKELGDIVVAKRQNILDGEL